MKGFITRALALVGLAGGLAAMTGCEHYRYHVDPCYPQRYSHESRQATLQTLGAQVSNGHILDQTVWNYHFETGTDKLTPGGREHLNALSRRRPQPDPHLFLQTAYDVTYDPANPDKFAADRSSLDGKRVEAIQRYLGAQTAGRPMGFVVSVHDPSPVGLSAVPMGTQIQRHYGNFPGVLGGAGGGGGVGVGGGGGGGTGGTPAGGGAAGGAK